MPVWPHGGEFRYCPQCGDVWRVARRGQHHPVTGVYREGAIAERRTLCDCDDQSSPKDQPRLRVLPDQEAAEAAWRLGGDAGVRALVPPWSKRPRAATTVPYDTDRHSLGAQNRRYVQNRWGRR